MDDDSAAPFTSHLEELRSRLIRCFIYTGVGFLICYSVKDKIFQIVAQPLLDAMGSGGKLIFTGLPEPFFAYLKVSLLAGVILALPGIMYEAWKFVAPGLYSKERTAMVPLVFFSCVFFGLGVCFAYFLVFPFGFKFFLSFQSADIEALPTIKEYLGLATKLLLAFGVVFEMPLFITAFARFGLVDVAFLKKNRKYALVLFFLFAAILTPPDVITQILMALPLLGLYEISILGARVFGGKKKTEDEALAESEKKEDKKEKKKKKKDKKEKKGKSKKKEKKGTDQDRS